ncbi:heterokaryon incompatibility, partial [Leptodontidium sp. MPI-SDFR-AT-0119]
EICPSFTALSYVWGPFATPKETLDIGASQIAITRNCRDALQYIRKLHGAVTIWVDAIYIDQDNEKEKEHQIPLMGNIYTMAKFVYTWLGNETLETARAMDSIAAAAKISPILLDREYLTGYPLTCDDLEKLFSRPWFVRSWTFQESILASDAIL